MTKIKVVLDTNVILSGIIFGGNSRHILDLVVNGKITSLTSPSILLEISQTLTKKFKWSKEQVVLAVETLVKSFTVVRPKIRINIVKVDKSDNKIIEAADEGKADYIISGDNHLLKIGEYGKIKILSPSEFLLVFLS